MFTKPKPEIPRLQRDDERIEEKKGEGSGRAKEEQIIKKAERIDNS